MGYPRATFVRGAEIDPNLLCSVCHDVFAHPVRTPCGHVFCRDCASAWLDAGNTTCISCRAAVLSDDALQPDRVLDALIGNLATRCPNAACPWRGKHGRREAHLAECAEERTACPHAEFGCPWKGKRCDLKGAHLTNFNCRFHACADVLRAQRDRQRVYLKRARGLESRVQQLESIIQSRSPRWLDELQLHDRVDARDCHGRWFEATVVGFLDDLSDAEGGVIKSGVIEIHFDGWSDKHNEEIVLQEALATGSLAPLHTHTVRQRKRARRGRHWREFQEGDILDAKDTVETWREAVIVNVEHAADGRLLRVFIHYSGWPRMWDEWISQNSARLAPHGTHSTPRVVPAPGAAAAANALPRDTASLLRLLLHGTAAAVDDAPEEGVSESEEATGQAQIVRELVRRSRGMSG
jgi:hypothetical protein